MLAMSYPSQWTGASLGLQVGSVSSQAGSIHNQTLFSKVCHNSHFLQPATQIQINSIQPTLTPSYSSNGNAGYSLYNQPIENPYGTQSGSVQPRQAPGYCFPPSIRQKCTSLVAALRGAVLLLTTKPTTCPQHQT